ncbi:hypothetical protein BKI52_20220 [marine bacterium AO1-C]|nr:hypothetical protein BKI52_20220 [marine bacterium AO1-C]
MTVWLLRAIFLGEMQRKKIISWVLFWLSYWLMIFFIISLRFEWWLAFRRATFITAQHAFVAHVNLLFLLPLFFVTKKYTRYVLSVLLLIGGVLLFQELFFEQLMQPDALEKEFVQLRGKMFIGLGTTVMVLAASTAYRVILINTEKERELTLLKNEKLEKEKEATALRSENLETELKFLKSQINPHFLFNALHNIYTLSYIKSDLAPEMILKLSDMLRYILYDCTAEQVPLGKEINYLENYVKLQQLKAEEADIVIKIAEDIPQNLPIAPMLMVPFLENSFKHGKIEDTQQGWVRLQLNWQAPHLTFRVENSVPASDFTKDKVGGIGIANVKRRLELLYKNKHVLEIDEGNQEYRVYLRIEIDG